MERKLVYGRKGTVFISPLNQPYICKWLAEAVLLPCSPSPQKVLPLPSADDASRTNRWNVSPYTRQTRVRYGSWRTSSAAGSKAVSRRHCSSLLSVPTAIPEDAMQMSKRCGRWRPRVWKLPHTSNSHRCH